MRDVEPEMNKTVGAALQQWRLKQQVFHFVKACAALSGKSLEGEKKKKKKGLPSLSHMVFYTTYCFFFSFFLEIRNTKGRNGGAVRVSRSTQIPLIASI